MRTRPTLWDGLIYLAVLTVAILLLLPPFTSRGDGETLVVICAEETTRYSLSLDRELTFCRNGYTLNVSIQDGCVSVLDADCPDRLCCRMGKISENGASLVCLPAGFYLKIEGGDTDEVDFIAG